MKTQVASFGLSYDVIKSLHQIFSASPEVEEVIIFGSRAKGNYSEGSDVDLVIKGKTVVLDTILNLMFEIEKLELLYRFDIQNFNTIHDQHVLDHIERVGKVLWNRYKKEYIAERDGN